MCVDALWHGYSSLSILGRYSFTLPFACCSLTWLFFTYFSKSLLLACCSLAWPPTCFATPLLGSPLASPPHCYSTSLLPTPPLLFHIPAPRLLFATPHPYSLHPACCSTFLLPTCCSFFFLKGTFGAPLCLYSPRLLPACLLLFLAYVSPDGTPSPSFSFASSLWSYNQQVRWVFLRIFLHFLFDHF